MRKTTLFVSAVLLAATTLSSAIAQNGVNPAVKARQSIMQLYAFNLGQLGAMAKGDVEYNADAASAAAGNLASLTQLNQMAMWPQGTDNENDPHTRALPAIWTSFPDVGAKGKALADAAAAMQVAAGTDLDSLRGAIGAVGSSCGACHKAYRGPAR